MIFSKEKVDKIMEVIDFQYLHFSIFNIGAEFLSSLDKKLLKKYGVDPNKIQLPTFTPTKKAFLFGKLSAALKDQTEKIDYNDFLKYLRRGQFIPLKEEEKNVLNLLEGKLVNSLRRESSKVKQDIQTLVDERNNQWKMDESFKELVKEQKKISVLENRTKKEMVLEIGHKTEKWEKDLGRIAETELQDIYQYGKLVSFSETSENSKTLSLVYKNVFPGACKSCIQLYLTNGVGSTPKLFTIDELIKNGTNIGRKQADWKPVVGTVHPFCRCELGKHKDGDIWNKEKQVFTLPSTTVEEAKKIKGEIKIMVGDKVFYV